MRQRDTYGSCYYHISSHRPTDSQLIPIGSGRCDDDALLDLIWTNGITMELARMGVASTVLCEHEVGTPFVLMLVQMRCW
jgi:hypothetical protein